MSACPIPANTMVSASMVLTASHVSVLLPGLELAVNKMSMSVYHFLVRTMASARTMMASIHVPVHQDLQVSEIWILIN